ncbi:MAG: hypothetical protein ACTS7E_03985 [Arsenophonus sp. NC-CH8-MAG3]
MADTIAIDPVTHSHKKISGIAIMARKERELPFSFFSLLIVD